MNNYTEKKDYKISQKNINTILTKLERISCRTIHYMGYADTDLIVALKDKYELSVSDYFGRTNAEIRFHCEGSEEEGYTIDGTPIDIQPMPEWIDDIGVYIDGIPIHDVLILDLPWNIENRRRKAAEIVFLLGDADSSNIPNDYTWNYEDIWIGRNEALQRKIDDMKKITNEVYNVLLDAEAIIITAGAGMGVDSGLPDFRGNEGFWKAYPPIAKLGYEFTQMANPALFAENPKLAWGFYGHRLNLYRSTIPHDGFKWLLKLVNRLDENYFVFTSNVDGQFQKAGFDEDRIYEVHGSIHHLQCTEACRQEVWKNKLDDIEINIDKLESKTLPTCKYCSNLARPNILMFGDWSFIGDRSDKQSEIFYAWKAKNRDKKIVIIEIGAGSTIPTVRNFGDKSSSFGNNVTLIRINPREAEVNNDGDISIELGALAGIEFLQESYLF